MPSQEEERRLCRNCVVPHAHPFGRSWSTLDGSSPCRLLFCPHRATSPPSWRLNPPHPHPCTRPLLPRSSCLLLRKTQSPPEEATRLTVGFHPYGVQTLPMAPQCLPEKPQHPTRTHLQGTPYILLRKGVPPTSNPKVATLAGDRQGDKQ